MNGFLDGLKGTVSERNLVDIAFEDGGRIDAFHGFLILVHMESGHGLTAAIEPATSMRGAAIPVGVAFANAKQTAFFGVDGDDDAFAKSGADGAMPRDSVDGTGVVVTDVDGILDLIAHVVQNDLFHIGAVIGAKLHKEIDIMKKMLPVFAF